MRSLAFSIILFCLPVPSGFVHSEDFIRFPANDSFLPASWAEEPIKAEIEPLDEALQATASEILKAALVKYPESLLKEFLDGIYVVGSLRFYGVGYGGTYMANAERIIHVYHYSYDTHEFEQHFHHEFSCMHVRKNEGSFEQTR